MKIITKIILCCITLIFFSCKTQNSISKEQIKSINSFLSSEVKTGFSGTVLISNNNKILLNQGYGLADREQNIQNNESTIFEIASITKLFTVVSILKLAEKGELSLTNKINQHLGDFNSKKDLATINHLLLHTAGLVPKGFELDYSTKSSFLKSVKNSPIESIPGEKYRYTNAGYIMLAAIIEEVSKMSYEDYLIENIFKPLNLSNTTFGFKDSIINIANGYSGKNFNSLKLYKTSDYIWGDSGPSGILTNTLDLHKFLQGLDNGKLLGSEYLQKMYSEQMKGEAYGFHILHKSSFGKTLTRGGGLPHFESQIAWYKEKNIKVIILINNHLRKRQPIWDQIEKTLSNQK